MKHMNLVEQCECCDNKFSHIDIPHMSERHKRALSLELFDTLIHLKAKGSCFLVCVDGMIVAINYDYAGNKEANQAKKFYKHLLNTADDYFQFFINKCEVEYYELAA